jgi:lipoprotein-releasing system permease protein
VDLLLVSWRFLVARPITLVSMLSVTFGLGAIIIVDSVMNGFLAEQRSMIRALTPDVSVDTAGLPADRAQGLLAELRGLPEVRSASPRSTVAAMHRERGAPPDLLGLPGFGGNYFVELLGIEREEAAPSGPAPEFPEFLSHEEFCGTRPQLPAGGDCPLRAPRAGDPFWFDVDEPFWRARLPSSHRHRDDLIPVVFGEYLAVEFGYALGTVVTVATLVGDPQGGERLRARSRECVVTGTFATRDHHFDQTHALVPRAALAEFAALPPGFEEIGVGGTGLAPAALGDRIAAVLADSGLPAGRVRSWEDQKSLLLGAVENERRIMNVAMFFVVIVATFSLFVTLLQLVRRKTRDLGVLAALGSTPARGGLLFLTCGSMVTLCGAALGVVCGLLLTRVTNPLLKAVHDLTGLELLKRELFRITELPMVVDGARIAWYALATIVCGTLFTLLPSLRAARLDPVEALRHE